MNQQSQTFRFAIGSPQSLESWIRRLWVHRDDVYLGARDALTAFKVSLHESGIWRVAFVKELERQHETDRVIVRWNRPIESAGWTPSIGLLISSVQPQRRFTPPAVDDTRITWFPPPTEGHKLIFRIMLSTNGSAELDLKTISSERYRPATYLTKRNGERVWLIVRNEELTLVEAQSVRDVMLNTRIHLKAGAREDAVFSSRAISIMSVEQPSANNQPMILDIPLGKDNLVWTPIR